MTRYFLLGLALIASGAARADILMPTGLGLGDQYRLAFVTSTDYQTTAVSTDIADYNAVVTNAANSQPALAALGVDWRAVVSTPGDSGVSARENTGTTGSGGVPIFLVDGTTKIVDDYADLWDNNLDRRLDLTEAGERSTEITVWTGTLADGSANPAQPIGGTFFIGRGAVGELDSEWIATFGSTNEDMELSIYAISGLLTVSDAAPIVLPGDYNEDGLVDAADYSVWRDNVGADAGTLPNDTAGGMIGDAQRNLWAANFGQSNFVTATAVPEATAAALLGLATCLTAVGRR